MFRFFFKFALQFDQVFNESRFSRLTPVGTQLNFLEYGFLFLLLFELRSVVNTVKVKRKKIKIN